MGDPQFRKPPDGLNLAKLPVKMGLFTAEPRPYKHGPLFDAAESTTPKSGDHGWDMVKCADMSLLDPRLSSCFR